MTNEGTVQMIVIGVDTHKRLHTLVAVDAATGGVLGERTIVASDEGALAALRLLAGLGGDRVWAIEDCRHVSVSRTGFGGDRVDWFPTLIRRASS